MANLMDFHTTFGALKQKKLFKGKNHYHSEMTVESLLPFGQIKIHIKILRINYFLILLNFY
jgi:hypothetical protein